MTLSRSLIDTYFDALLSDAPSLRPAVSTSETAKAFTLQMDLPGVPREAIKLHCERHVLTIHGERIAPQLAEGATRRSEMRYGKFMRQFTLPEAVDTEGIEASLSEGVLTVRVPKGPSALPIREIKIS